MFKYAHKKVLKALNDSDLRKGSRESTKNEMSNRINARSKYRDIDKWRKELRDKKLLVMGNFDKYLNDLRKNLEEKGFIFHYAGGMNEARKIILQILGNSRLVVKSKSMVGEEIGIRELLSGNGIIVYETDLGEFLVQISGGKPAHMVTPAVNITAEKASRLLERYTGKKTKDINEMVLNVRRFMREKFFSSDTGIIGANAISSSGEIVFITNEGNGALSHILPDRIVLITSVEKILPNLETCIKEAIVQTVYDGYRNISYIHILNSPGKKEFHVVLLNNGRRENFSAFLSETLLCIKCGSCQLACPVFKEIDGAWGETYTAAIGIPWTYITGDKEKAVSLSYFCLACGLCRQVCPMEINIPGLIRKIKGMH